MDKLNMQTTDVVDENIKRIGELFPNCLTEVKDEKGRPQAAHALLPECTDCAKKLFNEVSTSKVRYHEVDGYDALLDVMKTLS